MQVLAIAGSLRADSYNRMLLRAAGRLLPTHVRVTSWDALAELPAYAEDLDGPTAPVLVGALRQAIESADGLLIATPEYNASLPGALKNALDWASRPYPDNVLRRKPAAVIGASTGLFGAVWAQAEVRKALRASGADVLEAELPVGQADRVFDEHGDLSDPELSSRLAELLDGLLRRAQAPVATALRPCLHPSERQPNKESTAWPRP